MKKEIKSNFFEIIDAHRLLIKLNQDELNETDTKIYLPIDLSNNDDSLSDNDDNLSDNDDNLSDNDLLDEFYNDDALDDDDLFDNGDLSGDFYDDMIKELKNDEYKSNVLMLKDYDLLDRVGKFINKYDIDISCLKNQKLIKLTTIID